MSERSGARDRGGRRGYHSPLRREQAESTRRRIIEAAAEAFIANGYAGTTMRQIASLADVSVERIHALTSKADLLVRAFRLRYTGEHDWDSVLVTTVITDLHSVDDPRRGLVELADFMATAHARSAELWVMIRVVALSDDFVKTERDRLVAFKRDSFQHSARWLIRIGVLDPVPEERLRDLATNINIISSAETYLELRHDWQVDDDHYRRWLTNAIQNSPVLTTSTPATPG